MAESFFSWARTHGKPAPEAADSQDRPVSRADYHRFRQRRLNAGGWTPVFDRDLAKMSISEAALVSRLIGFGASNADSNGWTWVHENLLLKTVGLAAEKQQRVLDKLVGKGIVQVKYQGNRRLVRVILAALD
jgi:hypothetical protein